jgi:hypothetical protein
MVYACANNTTRDTPSDNRTIPKLWHEKGFQGDKAARRAGSLFPVTRAAATGKLALLQSASESGLH